MQSINDVKRLEDISRETFSRLERAMVEGKRLSLIDWPESKPSREELIRVAGDFSLFDGLSWRIHREPVERHKRELVNMIHELHDHLVRVVRRFADDAEWDNGGEPTKALRLVARAAVTLTVQGGDIRGGAHDRALGLIDDLMLEGRRRGQSNVVALALIDEIIQHEHVRKNGRLSSFDVASMMEMVDRNGVDFANMFRERMFRHVNPVDPKIEVFASEDPGVLGTACHPGRWSIVTWVQKDDPYTVSRDPLCGAAVETRNMATGEASASYVWRGEYLGRGDDPFDLVLERFAEMFPEDFRAALDRWAERMNELRHGDRARYSAEVGRLMEAADRLTFPHDSIVRSVITELEPEVPSFSLRM